MINAPEATQPIRQSVVRAITLCWMVATTLAATPHAGAAAQSSTSGTTAVERTGTTNVASAGVPLTDAADSAAAARGEYRLARELLDAGDTVGAMGKLQAAAHAFPMQPAYLNSLMMLAGLARATTFAASALQMSNDIGLALPASADSGRGSVRMLPNVGALVARQDALRAPIVGSAPYRILSDSTFFPEGLTRDARTETLYVSSLAHRNILALPANGAPHFVIKVVPENIGGIYGIAVDTLRNVMWATSAAAPGTQTLAAGDTALPALLEIRLSDGVIIRRLNMRTSAPLTSPGDIALSPNGDVLVSDSQAGVLWRLPAGADSLLAIRHHLFRSLQGIAPSPDGRLAWIADYAHGLLRVELPSGIVTRVADLPGHSVIGLDGLVAFGNTLIGVQNLFSPGQIVQLTLNADGTRIVKHAVLDRNDIAASPTGGVLDGNAFVYVANSLWDMVQADGTLPSGAARRAVLLRLEVRTDGKDVKK